METHRLMEAFIKYASEMSTSAIRYIRVVMVFKI
jgi:hypothetical protein